MGQAAVERDVAICDLSRSCAVDARAAGALFADALAQAPCSRMPERSGPGWLRRSETSMCTLLRRPARLRERELSRRPGALGLQA